MLTERVNGETTLKSLTPGKRKDGLTRARSYYIQNQGITGGFR